MADEINEYKPMKSEKFIKVFTELKELKDKRKVLDDEIKALEAIYKPMVEASDEEGLYFELPNHVKLSITRSERKGNINTKRLEEYGINVDEFRNKPSVVYTLRFKD